MNPDYKSSTGIFSGYKPSPTMSLGLESLDQEGVSLYPLTPLPPFINFRR